MEIETALHRAEYLGLKGVSARGAMMLVAGLICQVPKYLELRRKIKVNTSIGKYMARS